MQLRQALRTAIAELEAAGTDQPRLQAEVLAFLTFGCDRAYLFTHPERELSADEQSQYEQLIRRRAAGEPLQYITGHQEFWKADFLVTPAVLIPRPETEHLIEAVLELVRQLSLGPHLKLIDVGTGSGAIAITLARELPQAEVHAVDLSPEALEIARLNARRLEAQVHFAQSDLLASAARDVSFDFVVSNPPYVAESEPDAVQEVVRRHEPPLALFAGHDGLDVIRRLIPHAREALRPGGWLLFEIGHGQVEAVRRLLTDWDDVHCASDLAGIPRVVVARKPQVTRGSMAADRALRGRPGAAHRQTQASRRFTPGSLPRMPPPRCPCLPPPPLPPSESLRRPVDAGAPRGPTRPHPDE